MCECIIRVEREVGMGMFERSYMVWICIIGVWGFKRDVRSVGMIAIGIVAAGIHRFRSREVMPEMVVLHME